MSWEIEITLPSVACPDGRLVEWWPSSAKLVLNKQWSKGIHCHDWQQARDFLDHKARVKDKTDLQHGDIQPIREALE